MKIKNLVLSYLFFTLAALGVSLTVKANIGVSSFNSMNLSIAQVLNFKIGTVTIFFNTFFLMAYMYLSQFKYKKKYLLQALSLLMFGSFINFFVYDVFVFDITLYSLKIFTLVLGVTIGALSIGMIVRYNIITFPLESLCLVLSESTPLSFMQLRYAVDVVSVLVSLSISVLNHLPVNVREGTIISMVLFSFIMNITSKQKTQLQS